MANTYDITQKLQAIADAIENGGGGGGGTTVIANPSGTPTDTLNTIQIASTIYDIAGGGGGGGDAYDRTVLATPNTVTPGEISLSDNISNYDDLEIVISFPGNTSKSAFRISADYFMSEFPYVAGATASNNHLLCCLYDTYYVRLIMGSANNKMYLIETNTIYVEEIAGIKYEVSGGGGASSADNVSYDNTQSGLTATNVQDAIDENADSIDTLNSKIAQQDGVNVQGNGSKTFRQLINELFQLIDATKITWQSVLVYDYGTGSSNAVFHLNEINPSYYVVSLAQGSSQGATVSTMVIANSSGSSAYIRGIGSTRTDYSDNVVAAAHKLYFYY